MIDVLLQRWGLKLLAVAIAFAIWLAVVGQNEHLPDARPPLDAAVRDPAPRLGQAGGTPVEASFGGIPVTVVGGDATTSVVPSSVRVRIVGPPSLISRIRPGQVRAIVDVTKLQPRAEPYLVPLSFVLEDLSPSDHALLSVRAIGRSKIEVHISDRRTPS